MSRLPGHSRCGQWQDRAAANAGAARSARTRLQGRAAAVLPKLTGWTGSPQCGFPLRSEGYTRPVWAPPPWTRRNVAASARWAEGTRAVGTALVLDPEGGPPEGSGLARGRTTALQPPGQGRSSSRCQGPRGEDCAVPSTPARGSGGSETGLVLMSRPKNRDLRDQLQLSPLQEAAAYSHRRHPCNLRSLRRGLIPGQRHSPRSCSVSATTGSCPTPLESNWSTSSRAVPGLDATGPSHTGRMGPCLPCSPGHC